ncbi:hypothetical protein [Fontibacter flavus]|uniref:Uncharacterized protein n=1 Tax=Fontibacter flavus TaxID=654838 RepID=A0ABV6FUT9_9BACT
MKLDFSKNTIVLHPGQKLSEYNVDNLNFSEGLPHGILNKRYTGIGATYCELNAPRNSIIVFPYRRLAKEKADKYKGLFVGTDFNNKSITPYEIKKFLRNASIKFKKICVVADSISKVIQAIKDIGKNPYKDYFLVLDEVEILQMQSGFRNRLPLCFDYFKLFENKCFVSATPLEFTDRDLKELPKYEVIVDTELLQILQIQRFSDDPHISVANRIVKYLESNSPKKLKFLIGINSITAISEMIYVFEQANLSDITVLLGEGSKENIHSSYTSKDIVDGKLPSKINLATCAYWNGIDINEEYFPVAISLNSKLHHFFSFENLVQFIGRCRLNKNQIPVLALPEKINSGFKLEKIKPEKRIEEANSLIDSLSDIITCETDLEVIKEALSTSNNGIIYKSINNEPKVNYLFGDLEKYKEDTILLLKNNGLGLVQKLESFFFIQNLKLDDFDNLYKPLSRDELYDLDIDNFLSYLNQDYPSEKLVDRIYNHPSEKIRLIAFWYLFGRFFYNSEESAMYFAKVYSRIDYTNMVTLSSSLMEGFRFYIWQENQYFELIKLIFETRSNKKNTDTTRLFLVFDVYKDHFPSIFKKDKSENLIKRDLGQFFTFFFGIETSNPKSKNQNKYPIKSIYELFPIFEKINTPYSINMVQNLRLGPRGGQLNPKEIKIEDIIDFDINKIKKVGGAKKR